jgi:hypothetical protein
MGLLAPSACLFTAASLFSYTMVGMYSNKSKNGQQESTVKMANKAEQKEWTADENN